MTEYLFCIEKCKAVSKCRLCRKNINPREVKVKIIIADDYMGDKSLSLHSDCALKFIIGEVKRIKIKDLKEETDKLKKIEGLL